MATFDKRALRRAFKEMRQQGIIAEEDWTCCMSCGVAEMRAVADECPPHLREPIGYCFYHAQDAENLAETGDAMLAFGSFGEGDGEDVQIGRMVLDCLTRAGVAVEWDGSERHRIKFCLTRTAKRKAAQR